ncbi:MAG TPA: M1 family metallopeptidase [Xanthomonadales bacterium]|nr:M1 family metallopeptidase [Xanthomonadales bacterium]
MHLKPARPLLLVLAMAACSSESEPEALAEAPYDPAHDYFTQSNYTQFATRHLALDLTVDFEASQLAGSATLFVRQLDPAARSIILDSRDLHIEGVSLAAQGASPVVAEYRVGERHETLGQPLEISLPDGFSPQGEFSLTITYRTDPTATALQWLPPELTAGGEFPMLYSQSQSIHARSWIPLQDTPSLRITYEAVVRTPDKLLALMSADNDPLAPRGGEYRFEMPQPIPSYLMAIAVGNFYFAPLGEQTGLYSEPELLTKAAWEFAETQEMMDRTEETYGPYQWGRYDLLVLPPSFPYGGMENPRLSFITPSLLAGDRSLTAVIAHELAHSWSGNLVSNATWRDIWLNEGFTSYLDGRLIEMLYGEARAEEELYVGYTDLLNQFSYVPEPMTALAPRKLPKAGEDSQGSTYYIKGQMLLRELEKSFGREVFDRFLADYFEHFQWQSITTEQFLDYLEQNLLQAHPGKYTRSQVERWVYEPGLPDDAEVPVPPSISQSTALAQAWAAGEVAAGDIPLSQWSPHVVINFINSLPEGLDAAQLSELDETLGLSGTGNAEIARAWFTEVAQRRHLPAYPAMESHLERFGRIWLLGGIYRGLVNNGADQALARSLFEQARHAYHPATVTAIEKILEAEKL